MTATTDSVSDLFTVYRRKIERRLTGKIALRARGRRRGSILLSYVTHPFVITPNELAKSPHTNPWECLEIADILLERGFDVDVIDWTNTTFIPRKKYVMVIEVNHNLERFSHVLPTGCIKIFYITGAHWRYQNEAEKKRLEGLKERRGCIVEPRRQMNPSNNIEYADYATSLGNSFAKSTYAFAEKPITQIPLLSTVEFPSPENKPFERVRKNFVWIGGGGSVHKGLDRVLECFATLPDYTLTVCGPVEAEKDFVNCYRKELYETENIKAVGRIDVRGEQFKSIVDNAIGLVYASCSEGQAGSVIVGLHAGLIPIITRESGVDAEPFGIRLTTASVEEIHEAVIKISTLPAQALQKRSMAAWEYARENHTRENFRAKYSAFIDDILKERNV